MGARPKEARNIWAPGRRRPSHRPKLSGARNIWASVWKPSVWKPSVWKPSVWKPSVWKPSVWKPSEALEARNTWSNRPKHAEARHRTVESCLKTQYMVASSEVRHRTVESFGSRFSVGEVDARTTTLEDERRRTMVVQRGSTDARIHVWGFKPFPQDV